MARCTSHSVIFLQTAAHRRLAPFGQKGLSVIQLQLRTLEPVHQLIYLAFSLFYYLSHR